MRPPARADGLLQTPPGGHRPHPAARPRARPPVRHRLHRRRPRPRRGARRASTPTRCCACSPRPTSPALPRLRRLARRQPLSGPAVVPHRGRRGRRRRRDVRPGRGGDLGLGTAVPGDPLRGRHRADVAGLRPGAAGAGRRRPRRGPGRGAGGPARRRAGEPGAARPPRAPGSTAGVGPAGTPTRIPRRRRSSVAAARVRAAHRPGGVPDDETLGGQAMSNACASASSWRRSTTTTHNPNAALHRDLELIQHLDDARLRRGVGGRAPLLRHRDHRRPVHLLRHRAGAHPRHPPRHRRVVGAVPQPAVDGGPGRPARPPSPGGGSCSASAPARCPPTPT